MYPIKSGTFAFPKKFHVTVLIVKKFQTRHIEFSRHLPDRLTVNDPVFAQRLPLEKCHSGTVVNRFHGLIESAKNDFTACRHGFTCHFAQVVFELLHRGGISFGCRCIVCAESQDHIISFGGDNFIPITEQDKAFGTAPADREIQNFHIRTQKFRQHFPPTVDVCWISKIITLAC